jgi:hypothetical protein
LQEKSDAQSSANGLLAKTVKSGQSRLQLESSDCNGFHFLHDAIGTVFNEDDGTWDNGMVKVYDNFPMIFYIQILTTYLYFAENHDTNRINEVCIKMISKNIRMTIFDCYRERDSSIVLRQRNWDEWRQRQR